MISKKTKQTLKRLIWLYFWLLLSEGVLRKWLFPGLSKYFYFARDPVLLCAYFIALKKGIFPKNGFIISIALLAVASLLQSGIVASANLAVILFGIRCNFLYLPLIFLIPKVFDLEDVKKIGKWVLLVAIPMAPLVATQFMSSPDNFINRTAGAGGMQLMAGHGKIRPAGTFSFVTGPVFFFAMTAAFLTYGLVKKKIYQRWLIIAASISLAIGIITSGSRSAVMTIALVAAMLVVIFFVKPRFFGRYAKLVVIGVVAVFIISSFMFFKEGIDVLEERFAAGGGFKKGIIGRVITDYTDWIKYFDYVPFFGYGIGTGTRGAAVLATDKAEVAWVEREWPRAIVENGWILGFLYILLRIAITIYLWRCALWSIRFGNILPILLFGACVYNVLTGPFGQATTLGFTVFIAGLCLAAARVPIYENSSHS